MTIRKDDLLYILQQWPEVMEEVTLEAEQDFQEIQVRRGGISGEVDNRESRRRKTFDFKSVILVNRKNDLYMERQKPPVIVKHDSVSSSISSP